MSEISHITVSEAQQLEDSFLRGLGNAQDAFEQMLVTSAWLQLGYVSFVDWWTQRVAPVLKTLAARPQPQVQERVIKQIAAEEAALPKAQRHSTRAIAELVGVSHMQVSRSLSGTNVSDKDLATSQKVIDATVTDLEKIERIDLSEKLRAGEVTVSEIHDTLAAEAAERKKLSETAEKRTAELLIALRKLRRVTRDVAVQFIELVPLGVTPEAPQVFSEHIEWVRVALQHIESTLNTGTLDDELAKLIAQEMDS